MAYNPYYVQPQYPTYNQGYYSTEKINNFYQSMPNQNSFSTGGSFQQAPQQQQQQSFGGGDTMNKIGGVAQGVGQIAGYIGEGIGEANSIQTQVDGEYMTDSSGKPLYTLGEDQKRVNSINTNVGKGMVGKSVLSGASAGMTFGPWGAAIGAVVGLGAGLIGKGAARRRARKRKRRAFDNLQAAKYEFNRKNIGFEESMMSRQAYEDQLRNNNPYGFPSTYY
jgi:hypothetical protein